MNNKHKNLWIGMFAVFFLLISMGLVSAVAPNSSSVVAYWALENLTDLSGNGNTLTNVGASSGAVGIIDNGYTVADSQRFTSATGFLNSGNWSVSLWLNLSNTNDMIIFSSNDSNNWGGLRLNSGATGRVQLSVNGNGYTINTSLPFTSANDWHHYVVTKNGTNYRVWHNGVFIGNLTNSDTFNVGGFSIGYANTGTTLSINGVVDEFFITSQVLNQDNVNYLYASGNPDSSQQYPFTPSNLTINVLDSWTGSNVNGSNLSLKVYDLNTSGTVSGGVTINESTGAMVFNGSSNTRISNNNTNFSYLRDGVTLEAFVYINGSQNNDFPRIVQIGEDNNGIRLSLRAGTNTAFEYTQLAGGINRVQKRSQNIYTVNGLNHLIVTWNGSNAELYFNGIKVTTFLINTNNYINYNLTNGLYFAGSPSGANLFTGESRFFRIYNYAVNDSEALILYNGRFDYATFTSGLVGQWSGRDFNGTSGSPNIVFNTLFYNYSDVSSPFVTPFVTGGSIINYLNVSNPNYFFYESNNTNLSSGSFTAYLVESYAVFTAFDLFGNSVSDFNVTISGVTNPNSFLWNISAGTYNATFSKGGYYNLTQEITILPLTTNLINISNVYNSILDLTIKNELNQTIITNYSGNVSNEFYTATFSSNNGSVQIPLMINNTYLFNINPITGYATNYNNNFTFNATQTYEQYNLTLLTENSINFEIYKLSDQQLLNQTVNITLDGLFQYNFQTNNGTLFVDNITAGTYEVTFRSANYSNTILYVTINNQETINVFAYMSSGLQTVTFFIKDTLGNNIDEALITLSTLINGNNIVVFQSITDFSGLANVLLNPDLNYVITVQKDGFNTFSSNFKPIETIYTIILSSTTISIYVPFSENIFYNTQYSLIGNDLGIQFNILSSLSELQYFGLTTIYNNVTYTSNITGSPAGGSAILNITNIDPNIQNRLNITLFYKISGFDQQIILEYYNIPIYTPINRALATNLFEPINNLGELGKAIFASILILVVISIAYSFTRNISISMISTIPVFMMAYANTWYPKPLIIITLIIMILLILKDNQNIVRI